MNTLERVAKAIWISRQEPGDFEAGSKQARDWCFDEAQAALEALTAADCRDLMLEKIGQEQFARWGEEAAARQKASGFVGRALDLGNLKPID